jgi:hypothetical protein
MVTYHTACYGPFMRWTGPVRLAVTLALLCGACGGSGSGGGSTGVPIDDYVSALIDNNCAREVACGQMPDMATCVAATSIDLGQLFAAVKAGKTTYNGAAAATCLAASNLAQVACALTAQQAVPSDPSCAQVFTGRLPQEATCSAANDCLSNNCILTGCSGTPPCCTGTCAPPALSPVPVGGDCSAAFATCVTGAYCQVSTAICVSYVTAGQPCDVSLVCAGGLVCGLGDGSGQVCFPYPAEGESCGYRPCDQLGDYCDVTSICSPKIPLGGACPNGAGCVDYATCDPQSAICVARGKAGEACDVGNFGYCLGSLQCTAGICTLPPPGPLCP